ncbi:hypothetical protein BT63DRAFT_410260 [Microthyrium microscopicum]|uniref:Uncharacterized protein n=1 Tax=Microthyrium microscopicum TaxID=703497 RepID=A0A6A6UP71_9PEZI|nr:hypothetical protein BT63DRAFT_410260 [Microthyrium microscopicum]
MAAVAVEAPPPYTPSPHVRVGDPETVSIRSEAPSEVPSYSGNAPPSYDQIASTTRSLPTHSLLSSASRPINHGRSQSEQMPQGLPRLAYAPGFVPRPRNAFSASNFDVRWSSLSKNPVRKQYENVARRRAQGTDPVDILVSSLVTLVPTSSSTMIEPINETLAASPLIMVQSAPAASTQSPEPIHPHEDPDLVGPLAAERARKQREYREMMRRDPECSARLESMSWDFMLAQAADWDERERSWNRFRESRHSKKMPTVGRRWSRAH